MADFDIDMSGMDLFRANLVALERDFPKQAKSMLVKVGSKATTITKRKARQLVNRKTGYYQRSIKHGKVWKGLDGQFYVRVYSRDPKQFLIENGHRIVGKDGSEHGFQHGYKVFEKAVKEMDSQFESILVREFEKIMAKL